MLAEVDLPDAFPAHERNPPHDGLWLLRGDEEADHDQISHWLSIAQAFLRWGKNEDAIRIVENLVGVWCVFFYFYFLFYF